MVVEPNLLLFLEILILHCIQISVFCCILSIYAIFVHYFIEMDKKLQLAPMQAMTDTIFMNTYHKVFGGFEQMMAPYLLASTKSPIKIQKVKNIFGDIDANIDLIPQLLSNEAEGFLQYSNVLHEYGFTEVNWNLGCPFPQVAKKKRGSGLLPYPETIQQVLDGVMSNMKIDLSVKIRLGFYSQDEILPIIDILNNYPLKEIIIHPRTGVQKYDGHADIDAFAAIYEKFNAPVVYNGDILTVSDVERIEKVHSGITGYMIGRGAFINPFITNQIKGINLTENDKREKFTELYYSLHEFYKNKITDQKFFLFRMKELWQYFYKTFVNGDKLFEKIKTIHNVQEFETEIKKIITNSDFTY